MSYLQKKYDGKAKGTVLSGKPAGAVDHLRKKADAKSAVQPGMVMAGHVRQYAHANTSFTGSTPKGKHKASC